VVPAGSNALVVFLRCGHSTILIVFGLVEPKSRQRRESQNEALRVSAAFFPGVRPLGPRASKAAMTTTRHSKLS
jgi:hypothetical protein